MKFRDIKEAPENTVIIGIMPPDNKLARVQYVNNGNFAPQWKYCDYPFADHLAPWPLGWLYPHEVE